MALGGHLIARIGTVGGFIAKTLANLSQASAQLRHFSYNPQFGRADVVAEHPDRGMFVVEVEGRSSRQKEQALYSALGQLVLQMKGAKHHFVLAVPDDSSWERQLQKVPVHARNVLGLSCVLVSDQGVRDAPSGASA